MSGQWPPEWEDPDDGRLDAGLPDQRHSDAGHSDLELSEVTSFLASVHSPALPASFEARISAAIAAEAAARAATGPGAAAEPAGPLTAAAGADDAKDTVRSANPEEFSPAATAGGPSTPAGRRPRRGSRASRSAAAASRPGGSRPGTGRRRLRMPSMQAASWTLVCVLALAGFGFLVTHSSGSSSSSSRTAGHVSVSQSASAAAGGDEPQPASGVAPESPEHAAFVRAGRRPDRVPGLLDRHCLQAVNAGQPGAGPVGRPRQRESHDARQLGQRDGAALAASASASAASSSPSSAATCRRPRFPGACRRSPAASCPAWWTRPATTESRLTSSRCRLRCGWWDAVARRPTRSSSREYRSRASRESPRPSIG